MSGFIIIIFFLKGRVGQIEVFYLLSHSPVDLLDQGWIRLNLDQEFETLSWSPI